MFAGQDWEKKTWNKAGVKAKGEKKDDVIKRAMRGGSAKVQVEKKFGGVNKAGHSHMTGGPNMKTLEEAEDVKAPKVSHNLKMAIQKARQAKGWTQKELAQKISEKSTVINEYESGKGVPSPQILNKLDRVLGVRLPRPNKKAKAAMKGKKV
eukprot:TRINITY_DN782257_c0_g1_i1.p1 TRINITY_DN782257_c0_g1~~TRINITY_DN782257_c0_g1_i1.p1  ORF type:complete len:163 (-),score=51.98 TRINITY_DN782257_c0_g1_i1:119-574(-)